MNVQVVQRHSSVRSINQQKTLFLTRTDLELFVFCRVNIKVEFGVIFDYAALKKVHHKGIALNSKFGNHFLSHLNLFVELNVLELILEQVFLVPHIDGNSGSFIHKNLQQLLEVNFLLMGFKVLHSNERKSRNLSSHLEGSRVVDSDERVQRQCLRIIVVEVLAQFGARSELIAR
jgi:hypothetical protein